MAVKKNAIPSANHLDLRWDSVGFTLCLQYGSCINPTINRGKIDNWVSINFLCLNVYDRGDTRVVRIIQCLCMDALVLLSIASCVDYSSSRGYKHFYIHLYSVVKDESRPIFIDESLSTLHFYLLCWRKWSLADTERLKAYIHLYT